jgi:hypothetical protein
LSIAAATNTGTAAAMANQPNRLRRATVLPRQGRSHEDAKCDGGADDKDQQNGIQSSGVGVADGRSMCRPLRQAPARTMLAHEPGDVHFFGSVRQPDDEQGRCDDYGDRNQNGTGMTTRSARETNTTACPPQSESIEPLELDHCTGRTRS